MRCVCCITRTTATSTSSTYCDVGQLVALPPIEGPMVLEDPMKSRIIQFMVRTDDDEFSLHFTCSKHSTKIITALSRIFIIYLLLASWPNA